MLKTAVNRDNDNPFAWYQLGIVYDREGDQPRAALATAERNNLQGKPKLALASAEMAMRGVPQERRTIFARRISPWCPQNALKKDKGKREREAIRRRGSRRSGAGLSARR